MKFNNKYGGSNKSDKYTNKYYDEYKNVSPFYLKDVLIKLAKGDDDDDSEVLNAGRGNPNFFNKFSRDAFYYLSLIALELTKDVDDNYNDLVYYKSSTELAINHHKNGVYKELKSKIKHSKLITNKKIKHFLLNYLQYIKKSSKKSKMKPDDMIYNLITSSYGCFYPTPPKLQPHVEFIIKDYMHRLIFENSDSNEKAEDYDFFATEGAAAGILYAFNTLHINGLLKKGDTIAIITPIFSPYLEMPKLKCYDLNIIELKGDPKNDFALPDSEIDKLKNPEIKGLFCVNPTNPSAFCLPYENIKRIGDIVKNNRPDLIIVSDCVYSPFVKKFNSLVLTCPKNTIEIYSCSKYFGTTGWRLGITMIRKDNNLNKLFKTLSTNKIEDLKKRYELVSITPNKIPIMDRIVMDSRQVAEEHVGGLSTPQQTLMGLFLFYDYYESKNGPIIGNQTYSERIHKILDTRLNLLYKHLGIKPDRSKISTEYYALLPILDISNALFGEGSGEILKERSDYIDFVAFLAKTHKVVLLPGKGFGSGPWYIRVSLANLPDDKYEIISKSLYDTLDYFLS
jgi:aspartate 4-decarboxylase